MSDNEKEDKKKAKLLHKECGGENVVFRVGHKEKAEQMREKLTKKNGKDFINKIQMFLEKQQRDKNPEHKVF